MARKHYTDMPESFAVCSHADCPRAAQCLHQTAYGEQMERCEIVRLINPGRCTKDSDCPYYRDAAPVAYAFGFSRMKQHMYPAQYLTFMSVLKARFGHNPYYERRRGDIALPPGEQRIVLDALRQAGVTEDLEFDRYEYSINWCD